MVALITVRWGFDAPYLMMSSGVTGAFRKSFTGELGVLEVFVC
jgi:hypothetical protein